MPNRVYIWCLGLMLLMTGCFGSADQETEPEPDDIYFDFLVTGEEGNDSVTVLLKFKDYDEYGEPLSLVPGQVMLDGQAIPADSSSMAGPYYSISRSLEGFRGRHSILVQLPDQKKYRNEFSFAPFRIQSPLPDTIKRSKLFLDLEGLGGGAVLRVLMTDTSFTGEGIHRIDSVWQNRIIFTRAEIQALEPGPVNLELTLESASALRNATRAGGQLRILYSIRREFWLRD